MSEGPAVIKNNGKIFISFSASATRACYCMELIEADEDADLLDRNSRKKSRYPVLETDYEKKTKRVFQELKHPFYNPIHNSHH